MADSANFAPFAQLCELLAATSSKLAKRALIAEYLTKLDDASASLAATFLIGRAFPESDPRTLGVGGRALSDALLQLTGAPDTSLSAAYRLHGDLGTAANDLIAALSSKPAPNLTLREVGISFERLAATAKRTSRLGLLLHLLGAATPLEAKYLIKIMLGDMRTGVQQSLVEEAIAASTSVPLVAVRRAVLFSGDLGVAIRAARRNELDTVTLTLFHPLGFMLASPIETPAEAIERLLPEAAVPETVIPDEPTPLPPAVTLHVEDKFDGMRAQAHCAGPAGNHRVVLYSRNRQDVTASFPELATALAAIPVACILDGEVLGWDPTRQRALPFATFSNRLGRKKVSRELLHSTPVAYLAFDCLYADGRILLDEPLTARRIALAEILDAAAAAPAVIAAVATAAPQATLFAIAPEVPPEIPAPLLLSRVSNPSTVEQIEAEFLFARARGNEGLMIKDPTSLYTPGRRGYAWLKFKQELATLDVVITGAEFGHGRRAGILSDYTFAVRDTNGTLLNVGKAYSGLTDIEISTLSNWCMQHTLIDQGHFRTVEPEVVLEVACNNIMRSGRHNSGFAMRFPRIVRLRPDKSVAEIDTLDRVEEIYSSQPDKPAENSLEAAPEAATES